MYLEKILARHCSSVLLKKKPSALFSLRKPDAHMTELASMIDHHGMAHRVLCDRCENVLVFVYSPSMLQAALALPETKQTLREIGYPVESDVTEILLYLQTRIQESCTFPHEIGFFLGYPVEDVLGFIRHKGNDCKHCGLWKVYGDVPRAKAMFAQYHQCRQVVLRHLESGGSLYDLPDALAV